MQRYAFYPMFSHFSVARVLAREFNIKYDSVHMHASQAQLRMIMIILKLTEMFVEAESCHENYERGCKHL